MGQMQVSKLSEVIVNEVLEVDGAYLIEILERHESNGGLVSGVTCHCDSLPGDDDDHLFLFAYLSVLEHHVHEGQIDGYCHTTEEKKAWKRWLDGGLVGKRLKRVEDFDSEIEIRPRLTQQITEIPLAMTDQGQRRLESNNLVHIETLSSRLFQSPHL